MKKVVIESPYAGDVKRNIDYARKCVKWCVSAGYAPIASHLLYTQNGILNDEIEHERDLGIRCGLAWLDVADFQIFFIDYGITNGMRKAMDYGKKIGISQVLVKIL